MQFATDVSTFTCICCPLGCSIEVSFDESGAVAEVSGHTCKRGADYAAQEAVAPERMVTAVLCVEGCLEPVSVEGRGARLAVTAAVAASAVALLFAASAVLFFLIAELLQGEWLLSGSALVALAGLYLLAKRFMRVAANQNRNPLG